MADGAADHPAQHVAPPLVAGHHAVGDEEGGAAPVLGHHVHGVVGVAVGMVGLAAQFLHLVDQGPEEVRLVDGAYALHDDGGALQSKPVSTLGAGKGVRVPSRRW